jgi:Multiubiquitin
VNEYEDPSGLATTNISQPRSAVKLLNSIFHAILYGAGCFYLENDMHNESILNEHQKPSGEQSAPSTHCYKVCIDAKEFEVNTRHPSVEQLLKLADRKLCAYELIEILHDGDNREVEPGDSIDLHQRGLHGFITAHREFVTIFIKNKPFQVRRGEHTVDQILELVNVTSQGYTLYEEKPGHPPMPVPENSKLDIAGCEVFAYQVKSGTSS